MTVLTRLDEDCRRRRAESNKENLPPRKRKQPNRPKDAKVKKQKKDKKEEKKKREEASVILQYQAPALPVSGTFKAQDL